MRHDYVFLLVAWVIVYSVSKSALKLRTLLERYSNLAGNKFKEQDGSL